MDALTLTMDALGAGFSAGLRTDFCSVACRGYRLSISRARLPPPAGPGVRRVAVQVRGLMPFACGRCCFTLTGRVGAAPTPVCARQRERERDEGSGGHTRVGAGSLRAQEVSPPSGSREALPEALPNTSPRFVRGLLPSLPRGGWLRASGLLRPSWPGPCRVLGLGHQGGAAATPLPHAREVVGPPSLSRMLRDAGQPRGKKSEHVGASAPTQRRRFLWWLTSSTLGPRRVRDYRAPEPRHSRAESVEGPLRAGLCGL